MTTKHPTPSHPRRAGILAAGLAALLLGGSFYAWSAVPSKTSLAPREVKYLELAIEQIQRMEGKRGGLGPEFQQNLAAGALASAGLYVQAAAEGKADAAKRREDAVRWAAAALDACARRWATGKCGRVQLPLQRIVLQYPDVLPAELRDRMRAEVATAPPPPGAEAARDPWTFKETENQRMVTIARSLVAHTVAGTPQSPAAQGWSAYVDAFLLAHDQKGWYEAESHGYMVLSITSLLQIADHAPQARTRELAARQLDLIFAAWAQEQVGGFPAGAKTRTYGHWALSDRSTPWAAWAWMLAGIGKPEGMNFMERPDLALARYEVPESVVKLLTERRKQASYEIKERRQIPLGKRKDLNASLYSYATPDYILGTAQTVAGLDLQVSGGQEIVATLYAEGTDFAPVYLWSRTNDSTEDRWRSWISQDQAVGHKNLVLARLGAGEALGHAYLAPAWSQPEVIGDVAVSRYGNTYVALVSPGGWEVAAAQERFPDYYGQSKLIRGSWVAVPKRQPATVAMEVGRRAEHGEFETWKKRVATAARLEGASGAELRFTASNGTPLSFVPGQRAAAAGRALDAQSYPFLEGPFLSSQGQGKWTFKFGSFHKDFERLEPGSQKPAT
jgi:hypothetical protein